ncbi:hypothetical protein [Escherichia albertii]|uniref:hypothetical protein n=1 Tax=Escherichia albertii TaxID=208962 RepID=UPI00211A4EF2|nr:hypothetical protein [Escherichia albertii]MCQ8906475.1 hypothetical protein [Escherichia albertii]MCQ8955910.1 hypothetical protein [Escherichia albertii]MCQ8987539.1 hypothetical protein [Escherichia albertii]UUL30455.1 hypothetical protein NIY90_12650 [Escherichia albertii]UUL46409.1 hypothetical protein NIY84_02465 [Escherichia albertii]
MQIQANARSAHIKAYTEVIGFESGFDIKRFYFFPTTPRVAASDFRASGIAKGLLKNLQVSQVSRGMDGAERAAAFAASTQRTLF